MAGQLAAETTPGVFDTVATSDGPKRQAEDPAPGAAFGHVRAGPGAERRCAAERHQQPGVVEPLRPSVSRPSLWSRCRSIGKGETSVQESNETVGHATGTRSA